MALWASFQQYDGTLRQSVLCQLSLLFPLENWKTSINGSKRVLNLSLLFSKVCCVNFFLYKAGLPSINIWLITCYANLTSTYPLLGFLKWLECLEVGFREVVRGLVSPTTFMEGCGNLVQPMAKKYQNCHSLSVNRWGFHYSSTPGLGRPERTSACIPWQPAVSRWILSSRSNGRLLARLLASNLMLNYFFSFVSWMTGEKLVYPHEMSFPNHAACIIW